MRTCAPTPRAPSPRPVPSDRRRRSRILNENARSALKRLLREEFAAVEPLPDEDLARLVALIDAARQKQREAVKTAQEHALRFVPALLRKPLLKLFVD